MAEKEAKELEECTFKPRISDFKSPSKDKKPLHVEEREHKKSMGRTTEEIEFEKKKDECTFRPNLGPSKIQITLKGNDAQ